MGEFDKTLAERTVARIIQPKGFSWKERQREWVNGAKWGWVEGAKRLQRQLAEKDAEVAKLNQEIADVRMERRHWYEKYRSAPFPNILVREWSDAIGKLREAFDACAGTEAEYEGPASDLFDAAKSVLGCDARNRESLPVASQRELRLAEYLKYALEQWQGLEMTYRADDLAMFGMCQHYSDALDLCTETLTSPSSLQTECETCPIRKELEIEQVEHIEILSRRFEKRIAELTREVTSLQANAEADLSRLVRAEERCERLEGLVRDAMGVKHMQHYEQGWLQRAHAELSVKETDKTKEPSSST